MYVFPNMLKVTKQKWPTEAHQKVAESVLLCNPRYHTMTDLMEGARIIADIPNDQITKVTVVDLWKLGVLIDAA